LLILLQDNMKIIDKNIAKQTRGIFRAPTDSTQANEWRNIPSEKGSQQVLSDAEILELSELVLKIEKHYGFPCDIEWAREGGNFYIVQSRPITTLQSNLAMQPKDVFELEFTREINPDTYYLWFRGYLQACRLLSIDIRVPEKTFAIYDNGKMKCYTLQGNIKTMKDAANNLAVSDVEKIISEYLKGFDDICHEAVLTSEQITDIVAGFVITFIVGDIQSHPLASQALNARIKTEKLFTLLSRIEGMQSIQHPDRVILAKDQVITYKNELDIESFLADHGIMVVGMREAMSGATVHNELRGEVANQGIVRARVRKVLRKEQVPDVRQGEVLVAEMTHPDFLPALKKAVAIVTDEGGITCHAAIVSRELKKPCIIGTKIATQVLHDGDLVEVDAERGVVTILERADSRKNGNDSGGTASKVESNTKKGSGAVTDTGVERVMSRKLSVTTYADVDVSKVVKVHTREMSLLLCTLIGHSYRDAAKKVGLEDFFKAMGDYSLMVSNGGALVDLYRMKSALQEAQKQLYDKVGQYPSFLKDSYEVAKKERELVKQNLVVVEGLLKVDAIDKKTLTDAYVLLREIIITYFLLQATPLAIERVFQVSGSKVFLEKHSDTLVTWRKDFHELQQQIETLLDRFVRKALEELLVDFNYYTDSEVSDYLAGNVAKIDVLGRQKGYALLWLFEEDVPYELATGEQYSSVANHVARFDEEKKVTSGLYKGTGIGGGVVEGEVYLVKTVDDISQTPESAIIVANVLELEHLSRVKRIDVAGIVTEEGGITSHIAITGRELGIPIVMGVTGITNDIASGDVLSVDANTGAVTIKK
jgi:phosphohistidine swiveling domain-containing protein